MDWDLGAAGVGLLAAMSVGFGLVAQGRCRARGWATEEDLQPNYDGLSFDETLLAIFPGVLIVFVARRMIRRRRADRATASETVTGAPLSV